MKRFLLSFNSFGSSWIIKPKLFLKIHWNRFSISREKEHINLRCSASYFAIIVSTLRFLCWYAPVTVVHSPIIVKHSNHLCYIILSPQWAFAINYKECTVAKSEKVPQTSCIYNIMDKYHACLKYKIMF